MNTESFCCKCQHENVRPPLSKKLLQIKRLLLNFDLKDNWG